MRFLRFRAVIHRHFIRRHADDDRRGRDAGVGDVAEPRCRDKRSVSRSARSLPRCSIWLQGVRVTQSPAPRWARRVARRRDATRGDDATPRIATRIAERRERASVGPSRPPVSSTRPVVTHREDQVEEKQQVLDTGHAAGHHFRHSHCVYYGLRESLNRVRHATSVRARRSRNQCASRSCVHTEAENVAVCFAPSRSRFASDPPPFLSLFLFCRSSVRQRPELHGMLARRLFAVKCTGQCIFVVARYTLAMRAQPLGQGRTFLPRRGAQSEDKNIEIYIILTLHLKYKTKRIRCSLLFAKHLV